MNIEDLLKDADKAKEILEDALVDKNKELAELLIPIAKDPWLTYGYAYLIKKPVKDEWENIIAQDPQSSCSYAIDILHKPFIKGEGVIIKSMWLNEYVDFLKEIGKLNEFLKDHPEVKL